MKHGWAFEGGVAAVSRRGGGEGAGNEDTSSPSSISRVVMAYDSVTSGRVSELPGERFTGDGKRGGREGD